MACLGAVLAMAGEWGVKGKRGQSQGMRVLLQWKCLGEEQEGPFEATVGAEESSPAAGEVTQQVRSAVCAGRRARGTVEGTEQQALDT